LYWSVFPRAALKFFVRVLPLFRHDPTKFGRNGDINLREIAEHDYPPTTRIDVWPYYAIKQQASQCHTSQLSGGPGMFGRFPRFIQRRLNGYETFRLVEPDADGQRLKEQDLFADVQPA
jgi:LmbE family N-acetylglucosaminyl deacetylase